MISYQTENFGNRYEYRSNPHNNYVVPPHIHEYSEIAFTKIGVTTVIIGGEKYLLPKDHLILIMPNQIHEYSDETSSNMRCCVFSNDHVPAFFERIRDMKPCSPIIDLSNDKNLLIELDRVNPSDTVKICGLLNLICDKFIKTHELIPRTEEKNEMFYEVIQYVSNNFREDIKLKDIAKKLGYHEKYLSSALHTLTGMNFRTFLSSYRINYAKKLLNSETAETLRISDVAMQCGFSSINSFNRVFMELTGTTPSKFKNKKAIL